MNETPGNLDQILADFCERYFRDQAAGQDFPLAHYLTLFPGHEEAVAREFLSLRDEDDGEAEGDEEAAPESEAVAKVGSYRLLQILGQGGQATVWLAQDERLDRRAAVKILHRGSFDSPRMLDRFRREATLTSRLDDPGICPIFEIGSSGTPWIAMRYIEGVPLSAIIRGDFASTPPTLSMTDSGLPAATKEDPGDKQTTGTTLADGLSSVRSSIHLIEKVARSLHRAHEAGVVHRDIKPPNIMVTEELQPILLDFGIAMASEEGTPTLTVSGELIGTPAYMSPEQLSPQRGRVDRRTDVYSLGVTLFELLTKTRPFEGATREGLYRSILNDPVPDPRQLNPEINRDLALVMRCALSREADERYATAEAFADDLARVRQLETISVRAPSPLLRATRWTQRNPKLAAAFATTVLLLSVLLVVSLQLLRAERISIKAERQRSAAESARVEALEREALATERRQQLADPAVLASLVTESERLWPRRMRMIPEFEAWLAQAEEFSTRLEVRQRELKALRTRALPLTDEDQATQVAIRRELYPDYYRTIDAATRAIEGWNRRLKKEKPSERTVKRIERKIEGTAENLEKTKEDPRFTDRVLWRFEKADDRELHAALARLERGASRFEEAHRSVMERLEETRKIAQAVAAADEDWKICIEDLEGEVALDIQAGMIPLGKDRRSKLWEFWLVESGARPEWRGDRLAGQAVARVDSGMVFVLIPAGTHWIGAQRLKREKPHYDKYAQDDEKPPHAVPLDAFFLSKYEVTQAQWLRLMGSNPSEHSVEISPLFTTPRHPVERVSHLAATDFARRLDLLLPTEEQWEYAASGGRDTRFWTGHEASSLAGKVNMHSRAEQLGLKDKYRLHAPCGSLPPNPFGLHEVLGNVAEWTRSRWGPYLMPAGPGDGHRIHEEGFPGSESFVYRGGSFNSVSPAALRVSYRERVIPVAVSKTLGLRPARPLR